MVSRKQNRSKQQIRRRQQRGGDETCATQPVIKTNNCLGDPNVSDYIFPCKNLTANQFGFKDMGSYNGGSRKQRRSRKQRGSGAYPGVFNEHIYTPYDEWKVGLGRNAAINDQMEVEITGPSQSGGRRRMSRKQNKQQQKGGSDCNIKGYDDFFRGSLSNGGSRKKKSSRKQRGGNCSEIATSCLAANPIASKAATVYDNVNLGKTAISDGSANDLPTASELAWFFRNSYGATTSSNVVNSQKGGKKSKRNNKNKQKGGHADQHFFAFDEKIGGLPRVDHKYDIYPPSLHNVQVNGPFISDVTMVDELNYDIRNKTADVVGALEDSSLTRDSFEIPEVMPMAGAKIIQSAGKKKKNYLTRKSRKNLFGGNPASFPQSFNGANSDFSADMTTRKFDCHQPDWCPKCT